MKSIPDWLFSGCREEWEELLLPVEFLPAGKAAEGADEVLRQQDGHVCGVCLALCGFSFLDG